MSEKALKYLREQALKTGDNKLIVINDLLGKYEQIKTLKQYIKDVSKSSGLKEYYKQIQSLEEALDE